MSKIFTPSSLIITCLATSCFWLWSTNIILGVLVIFGSIVFIPGYAKYAFLLLEHEADGRADSPVIAAELFQPLHEMRHLYFVFIIGLFTAIAVAVYDENAPLYSWLVLGLLASVFPALIIVAVISASQVQLFNPLAWFRVIARLGQGYLISLGVLVLSGILIYIVFDSALGQFLAIYLALLLVLMVFISSGRFIYHNRTALGFVPENSPERDQEQFEQQCAKERRQRLDRIYAQRTQPRTFGLLLNYIDTDPDPDTAFDWYFQEMLGWSTKKYALELGCFRIKCLLREGHTHQAAEIRQVCLTHEPAFRCDFP